MLVTMRPRKLKPSRLEPLISAAIHSGRMTSSCLESGARHPLAHLVLVQHLTVTNSLEGLSMEQARPRQQCRSLAVAHHSGRSS
jgi:hypothetical protein